MAPTLRRAATLGAAAAAVAVALALSAPPVAAIDAGETCPCALPAAAAAAGGTCLQVLPSTGGGLRCSVDRCRPSWACTGAAAATHVCRAAAVTAVPACMDGARGAGGRCACAMVGVARPTVALTPWQASPNGGRGAGGGGPSKQTRRRDPAVWTPPVRPYAAPVEPACRTNHVAVAIEGDPFVCVAPIEIGAQSIQAAYNHVEFSMRGWATFNDFINVGFLRDAANRLYMCTTFGAEQTNNVPGDRHTVSTVETGGDATWYVQDDPTAKNPRDTYRVSRRDANGTATMVASNTWAESTTDGWCVAASPAGMVLHFDAITRLSGVAFLKGAVAAPRNGGGRGYRMSSAMRRYGERWATYGRFGSGPTYPMRGQNPRVRNIRLTPVCQCPR